MRWSDSASPWRQPISRLEEQLAALEAETTWPATPDTVARVLTEIRTTGTRPAVARPRWRLQLQPTLAAALLLLVALTAAIPPARSAVLHLFGIRGATIHRVPRLPAARPDAPLHLGMPVSFGEAQRAMSFRIRAPRGLGHPDHVLLASRGATSAVTLVYAPSAELPALPGHPGIGLLLTEFIGRSTPFIDKMTLEATRVLPTDVGHQRGYWIEDPHVVIAQYGAGDIQIEPRRRASRVLLWEAPPVSFRLESRLSRTAAVRLAERLR